MRSYRRFHLLKRSNESSRTPVKLDIEIAVAYYFRAIITSLFTTESLVFEEDICIVSQNAVFKRPSTQQATGWLQITFTENCKELIKTSPPPPQVESLHTDKYDVSKKVCCLAASCVYSYLWSLLCFEGGENLDSIVHHAKRRITKVFRPVQHSTHVLLY